MNLVDFSYFSSGMKKIKAIRIVFLIVLGISVFVILYPRNIWERNAKGFYKSFENIPGTTSVINDLSSFTQFEWDTLYGFAPYTPDSKIYDIIGYHWDYINPTVSEGMNQIVFLKDGKVVCYINGYPSKYKVYFKFPGYTDNYFKLTRMDKLTFNITISEDRIKIFDYIE